MKWTKRLVGLLTGLSLVSSASAISTIPTVFASTGTSSQPAMQKKSIQVNTKTVSTPGSFAKAGTMYMPIWYLMQALDKLGVSNQWTGQKWTIQTPSSMKPNLSNIQVGSGSSSIYINGKLVKKVDPVTVTDPASGKQTTYMPIWYLKQILIQSGSTTNWNGEALSILSKPFVTQVRQNVVNFAKKFAGTPYVWGGESLYGLDCSGLVQMAYRHVDISLPRVAAQQAHVGKVVAKSNLKPGDLVFFDTTGSVFSHVGIYVGGDKFISATTSHGVAIDNFSNPYYWAPRFTRATDPIVEM